jgi:hypothetical protein
MQVAVKMMLKVASSDIGQLTDFNGGFGPILMAYHPVLQRACGKRTGLRGHYGLGCRARMSFCELGAG